MKFLVNEFCKEVIDINFTYIFNHSTGRFFKIPNSIWNNILYYIENDIEVDEKIKDIFNFALENELIVPYNLDNNEKKLESITVQLTSKCNFNCSHCCATEISSKGDIDIDTLEKIIRLNPMVLIVSGGEPMLHPKFWEISEMLRKRYSGKISLSTNGSLINKENVKELYKYYDRFDLSVDGTNETDANKIRGTGNYYKVINAARILKSFGNKKVVLSLTTFKTSDEVGEFYDLNRNIGTTPLLRELYINGRVKENFDKIIPGGKREYINKKCKEFANNKDCRFVKCGLVEFQLFFDVKGNFYPCGGLSEDRFYLGNINNITLEKNLKINSRNYIINLMLEQDVLSKCRDCYIRGFCWGCLSEIQNFSKIKEVFNGYCCMIKKRWRTFLDSN